MYDLDQCNDDNVTEQDFMDSGDYCPECSEYRCCCDQEDSDA
jgi:hypothetical protein